MWVGDVAASSHLLQGFFSVEAAVAVLQLGQTYLGQGG